MDSGLLLALALRFLASQSVEAPNFKMSDRQLTFFLNISTACQANSSCAPALLAARVNAALCCCDLLPKPNSSSAKSKGSQPAQPRLCECRCIIPRTAKPPQQSQSHATQPIPACYLISVTIIVNCPLPTSSAIIAIRSVIDQHHRHLVHRCVRHHSHASTRRRATNAFAQVRRAVCRLQWSCDVDPGLPDYSQASSSSAGPSARRNSRPSTDVFFDAGDALPDPDQSTIR